MHSAWSLRFNRKAINPRRFGSSRKDCVAAIENSASASRVVVVGNGIVLCTSEHEVSIASAAAIFKHLDRARYEAVPIRIEKDGRTLMVIDTAGMRKKALVIDTE